MFTVIEKFHGRQKLIDMMLDHMKTHTYTNPEKGDMKLKLEDLDPFFTELIIKHKLGTKITRAWIHFMKPTAHHKHGHTHESNTGVFYLQVEENSSKLVFPDTGEEIIPKENMLAVVPKLTNHAMTENKSNGIRITLAFSFE